VLDKNFLPTSAAKPSPGLNPFNPNHVSANEPKLQASPLSLRVIYEYFQLAAESSLIASFVSQGAAACKGTKKYLFFNLLSRVGAWRECEEKGKHG
jgi:hypothetical protein